jgi:hypothetical protein
VVPVRDLLLDVLAGHRLTKLVVDDVITKPIREKIYEKWGPPTEESWTYLFTCQWCASVWIGAGNVAARKLAPKAWDPVAELLTISSVAGAILERQANNGSV